MCFFTVCAICSVRRSPRPSCASRAYTVLHPGTCFVGISEAVLQFSFRCFGLDSVGPGPCFLSTSFYVCPSVTLFFPIHLMFMLIMRRLSPGALLRIRVLSGCLPLQFVGCVLYTLFSFVICAILIFAILHVPGIILIRLECCCNMLCVEVFCALRFVVCYMCMLWYVQNAFAGHLQGFYWP